MKPERPEFKYPELTEEQLGKAEYAKLLNERIREAQKALGTLQYQQCEHIWIPVTGKDCSNPYHWASWCGEWRIDASAKCAICGLNAHGWYCDKSPTHVCEYDNGEYYDECCIHCGDPDERK